LKRKQKTEKYKTTLTKVFHCSPSTVMAFFKSLAQTVKRRLHCSIWKALF